MVIFITKEQQEQNAEILKRQSGEFAKAKGFDSKARNKLIEALSTRPSGDTKALTGNFKKASLRKLQEIKGKNFKQNISLGKTFEIKSKGNLDVFDLEESKETGGLKAKFMGSLEFYEKQNVFLEAKIKLLKETEI